MSRDGILPAALGRVHPKYQTPDAALALMAIPTWIIPFAFVVARTPVESVLGYLGTMTGYGFLVAYFLISIAAPVYLHRRGELRPHHVLISALAAGLMAFVFAGQLYPAPPPPYNVFPYLTAAYFVVGILFYVVLRTRAPHLAARVGDTVSAAPSSTS
jgi:amino acid transporter